MGAWLDRLGFVPSLLVASLSGVCFGLAAPPRPHGWLGWLGFFPLLVVLRRPRLSLPRAFAIGWAGGLGVGLLGFPWIAELLEHFAGVPRPLSIAGMVVHSAWLAVPYGLWALLVQWGPARGWPAWLWALTTFPAILHLWPVVFPYTPLIGFAQQPAWIQVAELGGVALVEFQALLVGLLLAEALRQASWIRTSLCAALAALVPLISTVVGQQRMLQIEAAALAAPQVRFGIVQPNVPVLLEDRDVAMQRLREPSQQAESEGAQIIVWPEAGTYPFPLPRDVSEDPSDPRGQVMLLHQTPTLFGAVTMLPDADHIYNTLLHLDSSGQVKGRFDKVMLVPFGEDIPLVSTATLRRWVPNVGQLARGEGVGRFTVLLRQQDTGMDTAGVESVAVGPMICAEDIQSSFARATAVQPGGIEVFVNSTIDAWYGVGQQPWEHLALAQFRSVEHRVPMVRSVSTGVSAVIDASGRVIASLPARAVTAETLASFPPETLVTSVALARNTELAPTWFARAGWLLPDVCRGLAFAQAALWAVLRLRRRRSLEALSAQGQAA